MRLAAPLLLLLLLVPSQGSAQKGKAPAAATEGLTSLGELTANAGLVDDAFALSTDGRKLAYVETDGTSFARLRVRDLAKDVEVAAIYISEHTKNPGTLTFLPNGRLLLVSKPAP